MLKESRINTDWRIDFELLSWLPVSWEPLVVVTADCLYWSGTVRGTEKRSSSIRQDTSLVNVKTIRRMTQIFVAFSEKLNFNTYAGKVV